MVRIVMVMTLLISVMCIEPLTLSVRLNDGSANLKIVSYDDDNWDD